MKIEINIADFAAQLKAGKGISGKDGALTINQTTYRDGFTSRARNSLISRP